MKIRPLIFVLLLCFLPALGLDADTLRLKNGKTVQGTIVNQSDSEVSIEVAIAGGSILKTETVPRSDIAELRYATAEEKAQEAMEQAYRETQKYTLASGRSFGLDYYDRILNNVLRPLKYPHPPSAGLGS